MSSHGVSAELVSMVESDWAFQESHKHRKMSDVDAILDLVKRGKSLCDDLANAGGIPRAEGGSSFPQAWETGRESGNTGSLQKLAPPMMFFQGTLLSIDAESLQKLPPKERERLYKAIRWQIRQTALQNPLLKNTPLVFMKRKRFVCQMLHEYLGYYYYHTGLSGGEVAVLRHPGYSLETQSLTAGKFPNGAFETLSLSYDAKTAYFAFTEVPLPLNAKNGADEKQTHDVKWTELGNHDFHQHAHEYFAGKAGKFHVYSLDIASGRVTQLTGGTFDDFDPVPLPDGGIAFLSTRRGGFIRCNNVWEPLQTYTLHRMNADGGDLRTLSFHETNEWHPSVLNDGRIVYSRWDYVDRNAAQYHGIWTTSPDGTQASVLFGNYTTKVSACYQPHAIPGSQKILFVAGAHHAVTGGSLVLLDPSETAYDAKTAEDSLRSLERLTPEVAFPETQNQWPDTYYHSPWPLSENYYLVSYSREPLGGYGPQSTETGRTGLYYFDRFGNMELLYEDANISCQYPIPLASRDLPPVIPDRRGETPGEMSGETGEFYLTNVRESFAPLPDDREITELRVFELLPKQPDWTANSPRLGHANAEGARLLLGTVPVEKDGSAYFSLPANTPVYFQAVDSSGKAVQTMRSEVYLQPGEKRSCIGCHEKPHSSPGGILSSVAGLSPVVGDFASPVDATFANPVAFNSKPRQLAEGPDGSKPLGYVRLIQPILDRRCVSCHDGTVAEGKGKTDLRGIATEQFSQSYNALKPYLRWYEWGGDSTIQQSTTLPGRCGADESPLTAVLNDSQHKGKTNLTDGELRTIYLWLDANVPFYGVYTDEARELQRLGQTAPIPAQHSQDIAKDKMVGY
ncbi:MAG: hypothetical protein FWC50_10800 [Planctomycetaceae bacterium]|nr:hypothetical protein [Planctomycetaceae bacterium]